MTNNVKFISVGYNPINRSNIFTSGDRITGQVTLELVKECKIESLCVKLKGKAEVKWTENYGKTSVTYRSKEKYFSIKQEVIQNVQGNIVKAGCHVYPFNFHIPAQDLPSSFIGKHGKIKYTLEANLSRSMRLDSKAKTQFTLVHNGRPDSSLTTPLFSTIEKKMNLFTSGAVSMDIHVERSAFHQGEGIKVVTSIYNKSSRDIRPKYCLYKKYSYFAKKKRKVETKDIVKEVGEPVPPSTSQTVSRTITIPPATYASILNCAILKAEYRLRVYLDVKYATDPEIKFPIVILPALRGPVDQHPPAYSFFGSDPLAYSNMPGGAAASGPSAPPPPSYEAYGLYPALTGSHRK